MRRKAPIELLGIPLSLEALESRDPLAKEQLSQIDATELSYYQVGEGLWAVKSRMGQLEEGYRWQGNHWDRNDNLLHPFIR